MTAKIAIHTKALRALPTCGIANQTDIYQDNLPVTRQPGISSNAWRGAGLKQRAGEQSSSRRRRMGIAACRAPNL
jgi:hypothetical protein